MSSEQTDNPKGHSFDQEKGQSVADKTIRSIYKKERRYQIGLGIFIFSVFLIFLVFFDRIMNPKNNFDILRAITFEAINLSQDSSEFSFVSEQKEKIKDYRNSISVYEFDPLLFSEKLPGIVSEGASLIEYDSSKIFVEGIRDLKSKQLVFIFSLKGRLSDVPDAKKRQYAGKDYYSFASQEINIILWQKSPSTLAILAGWLSSEEMVERFFLSF